MLGYPTGDRYPTTGGGWAQSFQNGRIHSSAAGTFAVLGALSTAYDTRSGEAGPFGYPSGNQYATTAGGVAQGFQGGSLVIPAGGQVIEVTGRSTSSTPGSAARRVSSASPSPRRRRCPAAPCSSSPAAASTTAPTPTRSP